MDKEAIARIVDPEAWTARANYERILEGRGLQPSDPEQLAAYRRSAQNRINSCVAPSLVKADAIIALQSSQGEAVEEPIPADPDKAMGWRAHKQGIGFAECRFKGVPLAKWEAGHKARSEWRRSAATLSPAEPSPLRRDDVIEECALVADKRFGLHEASNKRKPQAQLRQRADEALFIAGAIRALASPEQREARLSDKLEEL